MMWFFVLILWIAVSLVCLRCLNKDKNLGTDWNKLSKAWKIASLAALPVIYIVTVTIEEFEK